MKEFIAIIMISASLAACRTADVRPLPDPPADGLTLVEVMEELRGAVYRVCVYVPGEW